MQCYSCLTMVMFYGLRCCFRLQDGSFAAHQRPCSSFQVLAQVLATPGALRNVLGDSRFS